MRNIRLRYPFRFHHAEIPEGTVMSVPPEIAARLIQCEAADEIEPERAVIEPPQRRILYQPSKRSRGKSTKKRNA